MPATFVGHELPRVDVRVRDRDQRAEVEDDLAALAGALDGLRVDEITAEDVDLRRHLWSATRRASRGRCGTCSGRTPGRWRPSWRACSTRWLPMNPPAPVTSTGHPDQAFELVCALIGGTGQAIYSECGSSCVSPGSRPRGPTAGSSPPPPRPPRERVEAGHEVTVATTDVFDHDERLPPDAPTVPEGARVIRFRNVSHRLAAANVPLPRGLRTWLRSTCGRVRRRTATGCLLGRERAGRACRSSGRGAVRAPGAWHLAGGARTRPGDGETRVPGALGPANRPGSSAMPVPLRTGARGIPGARSEPGSAGAAAPAARPPAS